MAAIATVVALGAVGAVAGTGYYVHSELSELEVAPAYSLPTATDILVPATPDPIDRDALTATLQALADDPALGTFHARVSDGFTGEVLFDASSEQPLTPASSTKVLTAAAALYTLEPTDRITTQVVRGANEGDVVIKPPAMCGSPRRPSPSLPSRSARPTRSSSIRARGQASKK